jgi:hypothetical protein
MDTNALSTIETNATTKKLYHTLLERLKTVGQFDIEVKKTSLHIVHGRAFLGVHLRKDSLLLNIVTNEPLEGKRLRKVERVSANRYHNELLVNSVEDINDELLDWLAAAYMLTAA